MKIRLTKKDVELLTFLRKYKIMLAADAKRIYQSKGYHYKRLKVLENEKCIKRINRYYIKLDMKGIDTIKEFAYEYNNVCRKQEYQSRLKEIVRIATLTIDSTIQFVPSWELKDNNIFTETSRKFIGELIFQDKKTVAYYIAKEKQRVYISQIINDIQKAVNYKNVILFMENLKFLNKNNYYFISGKESTVIIKVNSKNLERMRQFQELDFYEILTKIYPEKEILLSNWKKADYMTNEKQYIVLMPFIDTDKLHRLNIFHNNNKISNRKIDIVTLSENKEKINEILTKNVNIIELDKFLGGMNGEIKKG